MQANNLHNGLCNGSSGVTSQPISIKSCNVTERDYYYWASAVPLMDNTFSSHTQNLLLKLINKSLLCLAVSCVPVFNGCVQLSLRSAISLLMSSVHCHVVKLCGDNGMQQIQQLHFSTNSMHVSLALKASSEL